MAPPVRQLSTAFSDLVLAFTAFGCAHLVKSVSPFTAGGFCAVGIAASFGVLKFGAAFPRRHASITKMHVLFTWLASTAGLPLIAAGFDFHHNKPVVGNVHLLSAAVALVISLLHTPVEKSLTQLVSSLSVLGILLITLMESNYFGALGAVAFGVGAAVNKVDSFVGLRGVDWFHYTLCVALLLFVRGLVVL